MSQSVAKLAVELVGKDAGVQRMIGDTKKNFAGLSANVIANSRTMATGIGLVAAGASVLLATTHQVALASATMGRELEASALAANLSLESVQAWGYAAESVGVDSQKAADILKDFQDKLGDFRANGGGEFADFFENVGDKVGLTADQLAAMAGPDALIAVKRAMDDANLSADKQISYFEAIADEGVKLLPILADNGRELRSLAGKYREMDVALTQSQLEKFKDYDQDVKDLKLIWDDLVRETVVPFVGLVASGARWMKELVGTSRTERLNDVAESIKNVRFELNQLEAVKAAEKMGGFEELSQKLNTDVRFLTGNTFEKISVRQKELRALLAEQSELQKSIEGDGKFDLNVNLPNLPVSARGSDDTQASRLASLQKSGASYLSQLDQQFANEQEKLALNLQQQKEQISTLVVSEVELRKRGFQSIEQLRADYNAKAELEYSVKKEELQQRQAEEDQRKRDEAQRDFDQVRQQLITKEQIELEAYTRRQQMLYNARQSEIIQDEKFRNLSVQNWQKYQNQISDIETQKTVERLELNASMYAQLGELTAVFGGEQSGLYKALMVAEKAYSIQSLLLKKQVTEKGVEMNAIDAISEAWASSPFPYNLPAVATTTVKTGLLQAAISSISVSGMAHDGITEIPSEGTWLLDKGERVLSPQQNADLTSALKSGGIGGNVVVNIVPDSNKAGTVEQSDDQRELTIYVNATLGELEKRMVRGGNSTTRALEGAYGLSRASSARR